MAIITRLRKPTSYERMYLYIVPLLTVSMMSMIVTLSLYWPWVWCLWLWRCPFTDRGYDVYDCDVVPLLTVSMMSMIVTLSLYWPWVWCLWLWRCPFTDREYDVYDDEIVPILTVSMMSMMVTLSREYMISCLYGCLVISDSVYSQPYCTPLFRSELPEIWTLEEVLRIRCFESTGSGSGMKPDPQSQKRAIYCHTSISIYL